MLKKSLIMLKRNPLLLVIFILAVFAYAIPMLFLLPETKKIVDISREITENPASMPSVDLSQITAMMLATMKIYLYMLIVGILGLLFIAGYGNMLAAAVNDGRASLKVFLFGIRKFFGKTFLSALLLIGIVFAFSIILSIFSIPVTIAGVASNNFNPGNMFGFQKIIQIITLVISFFLYPLLELWLPAIFLERKEGVIACFRKGLRAGLRKYLMLAVITAVMMVPVLLMYIFSGDFYSIIESPFYPASFVYQALAMPVILAYLFTIYAGMKKEADI